MLPRGSRRDRGSEHEPNHRESPYGNPVDHACRVQHGSVRGRDGGWGRFAEQARGGDRLAERTEHDPQRGDQPRWSRTVKRQSPPRQRDRDQRYEQADAEHRVAGEQQRQAGLAGGEVRDQCRAGRGGHHRWHHRHQPPRVGVAEFELVLGERQIRDRDRAQQAGDGAERPQDLVDSHRGAEADEVAADQERTRANREQRHRRGPVERGHGRGCDGERAPARDSETNGSRLPPPGAPAWSRPGATHRPRLRASRELGPAGEPPRLRRSRCPSLRQTSSGRDGERHRWDARALLAASADGGVPKRASPR